IGALGVDAEHGKLYVVSTSTALFNGFTAENAGATALFEFDLASGKFLKRYVPPADGAQHALSTLVVGKDGAVYAGDSASKQVFKLEAGSLRSVLRNPDLTRISALALSDDGRHLYLADFALGIFGFDLAKSSAFLLGYNPEQLVLGGIVGMGWYDGNL